MHALTCIKEVFLHHGRYASQRCVALDILVFFLFFISFNYLLMVFFFVQLFRVKALAEHALGNNELDFNYDKFKLQ